MQKHTVHVLGSRARVTIDVVECSTSQWTRPSPQAQSRLLSLARSASDGSLQNLKIEPGRSANLSISDSVRLKLGRDNLQVRSPHYPRAK